MIFVTLLIPLFILNLLTLSATALASPYKQIIQFSTPRSASTLMMRSFEASGQCTIFNEPSRGIFKNHHRNDQPRQRYQTLQEILNAATQENNIFVKEIVYIDTEKHYLCNNFLAKDNCYTIFLVRNPHDVAISCYKKMYAASMGHKDKIAQYRHIFCYTSYKNLYNLYTHITAVAHHKPYILISEEVTKNPHPSLQALCSFIGLPMTEKFLSWQPITREYDYQEAWQNPYTPQASRLWFDRLMASATFETLPSYAKDEQGEPNFEEIADGELRKEYMREYQENLIFYNKFLQQAGHDISSYN